MAGILLLIHLKITLTALQEEQKRDLIASIDYFATPVRKFHKYIS